MAKGNLISKAVYGTENAHELLLEVGINHLQQKAGYIPLVTDEKLNLHHDDNAKTRFQFVASVLKERKNQEYDPLLPFFLFLWNFVWHIVHQKTKRFSAPICYFSGSRNAYTMLKVADIQLDFRIHASRWLR